MIFKKNFGLIRPSNLIYFITGLSIGVLFVQFEPQSHSSNFNFQQLAEKIEINHDAVIALQRSIEKINPQKPANDISGKPKFQREIESLLKTEMQNIVASIKANQFEHASTPRLAGDEEQIDKNFEAYEIASAIISSALDEGTWTQEDAIDFRDVFGDLNDTQRNELLQMLTASIEANEVTLETQGFIF